MYHNTGDQPVMSISQGRTAIDFVGERESRIKRFPRISRWKWWVTDWLNWNERIQLRGSVWRMRSGCLGGFIHCIRRRHFTGRFLYGIGSISYSFFPAMIQKVSELCGCVDQSPLFKDWSQKFLPLHTLNRFYATSSSWPSAQKSETNKVAWFWAESSV